ncbi:MAG: accessory factor UbiK family protein [Gammaproteobacteria bacterium]|nr:accessory factor UbiK family protein [Gammaproteobacteria bacterium]
MVDLKLIENMVERIGALLPADVGALQDEFRANVRAVLEATLARMDVVTREEFDAQVALLRRTREKLDRLEATCAELEASSRD